MSCVCYVQGVDAKLHFPSQAEWITDNQTRIRFWDKKLFKNPCDILINVGYFCQNSGDGRNQIFHDFGDLLIYPDMSLSLEGTRILFKVLQSFWNSIGGSALVLPNR